MKSAISMTDSRFGMTDRGLITERRKADLILVKGNPLENVSYTLHLTRVGRDSFELQSETAKTDIV